MNKGFVYVAILLAMGCFSAPASAGVIYNWHQITSSTSVYSSSGQIEIKYAAWRSGYAGMDIHCHMHEDCSPEQAECPITHFVFWVNHFDYAPVNVFDDAPLEAQAGLTFIDGEQMEGNLFALTFQSQVRMHRSTDSHIWSIDQWRSDAGCYFGDNSRQSCNGATGKWVLDPNSLPDMSVPEPASLPLFAIAILAFFWLERRRRHSP